MSALPKSPEATQRERIEDIERQRGLIVLLNEWLADESGYDEETLPILKRLIDEDREGGRKLFTE